MKIALVHDYLVERGGAEKVLAALHEVFPDAPIYTSVYNPDATLPAFRTARVRTSFLQRLTTHPGRYRAMLPLYPLAFRSFDLSSYDVVLSSASGFAKGVTPARHARHICYCYTPPRFIWEYQQANAGEQFHLFMRLGLRALSPYLKRFDRASTSTVDRFLTSSRFVAERIASAYDREATVVPPPIDCRQFAPAALRGQFFLVLSRLVPYKRIDIAIEAFNRNGLSLLVVGDGRDRRRLESLARSDRIRFLGHRPQREVAALLARCKALVVAAEEDFGMTPLEANASGRPVIAYGGGGARDTVLSGATGVTFPEQTAESLGRAIEEFLRSSFDTATLVRHAWKFDKRQFQKRMLDLVMEELDVTRTEGRGARALTEESAA